MTSAPSRKLWLWVFAAVALGILFRISWPMDMEYKGDEHYMFERSQKVGVSEPLPWVGMASTVYVKHPAMGIWLFVSAARVLGIQTPVGLMGVTIGLNCLALLALLAFIARRIAPREQEAWLWGTALVAVNPFAVMYHRKIWTQSVLPLFVVGFLWAWTHRTRTLGAFFWGFMGVLLGQLHMSGFFFALGFMLWTLISEKKGRRIHWGAWVLGSSIGMLPALPWLYENLMNRPKAPAVFGWQEAIQLKFYVFWVTDVLGLHLGNSLGVLNGNRWIEQLGDFLTYPWIAGRPTYGMAVVHGLALLTGLWIYLRGGWLALRGGERGAPVQIPQETSLLLGGALWGYGGLMTVATVVVHRFYMIILFPLEMVWMSRLGLRAGRTSLGVLWVTQVLITLTFLGYIHVNGGSPRGDYGPSYRAQLQQASSSQ